LRNVSPPKKIRKTHKRDDDEFVSNDDNDNEFGVVLVFENQTSRPRKRSRFAVSIITSSSSKIEPET